MAKEMEFDGLRKTIFALQTLVETPDEEKQKLFESLVSLLIRKGISKSNGATRKWRSGCVDYILTIIPKLEMEELMLLIDEKDLFYEKFCFKPSAKKKSLYSELLGRGLCDSERYMNVPICDIYHRYTLETGLSPYEFPEEPSVVTAFVNEIEPFAIFNLD